MVAAVKLEGGLGPARVAWLAALEVSRFLPERTVLVRTEAVAHVWRRDLVAAGRGDLLIGTRFVTPLAAATAVLDRAGVAFTSGEESVRGARIERLLGAPLPLQAFALDVLRDRPGWSDALAATLSDLEASGIDADALRSNADLRCADLALLRERLDEIAGSSWTASRTLREAAKLVSAAPTLWPFGTPCLAEVDGHEPVLLARWLRALPAITIRYAPASPLREPHRARIAHLFDAVTVEPCRATTADERGLLATYLFASPDELTSPTRPRSAKADGSIHLEEHAGVEAELDAAVTWVLGEIAAHGTPLEQIAIVLPRLDPLASLLVARLDEIAPDIAHVIGGLPATGSSAGARIDTVLRALTSCLHIEAMADVLPILSLADDEDSLSRRDAIDVLSALGTAGGSPAHPQGARTWLVRARSQHSALAAAVASLPEKGEYEDDRDRRALARMVKHLRAIEPALAALDAVADALVTEQPLGTLWPLLDTFLRAHVRTGVEGTRILASLREAVLPLIEASILSGGAALVAVAGTFHALRLSVGRFGQPRVTVVSLLDAVGLTFRAVRVMGIAEGVLPSSPREDAVLPDAVRSSLGAGVTTSDLRVTAQLHALHRVVTSTTERLVLSVSRMDLGGRYREPSGVMIEAAAALGRPPLGTESGYVPDRVMLTTSCFEPARAKLEDVRSHWPVVERGVLARAAARHVIPPSWRTDAMRALERITQEPIDGVPAVMDGWFPAGPFVTLPGSSEEHPASASALGSLLGCPHRFLYERVLGWRAPPQLADSGSLDGLTYGSLFHETAEAFYRQHGAPFCEHTRDLDAWKRVADTVADAQFATFLESYPLVGDDVRAGQRQRLRRDLRSLLASDWGSKKTFVDVERAFGPLQLTLGGKSIFLHGAIDRLDVVGKATLVRDLKTGKAKPRRGDKLMPAYDVQLGIYGAVTRAMAKAWNVPATIQGAYVYPSCASGDDRDFTADFSELAKRTEQWVGTAAGLLEQRTFPRTPDDKDCTFCAFKPVCGSSPTARAAALLAQATDALGAFHAIKTGGDED